MTADDGIPPRQERIIAHLARGVRHRVIAGTTGASLSTIERCARKYRDEINRRAAEAAEALERRFIDAAFEGVDGLEELSRSAEPADGPRVSASKALADNGVRVIAMGKKAGASSESVTDQARGIREELEAMAGTMPGPPADADDGGDHGS